MQNENNSDGSVTEYLYIGPTKEQLLISVFSDGQFSAKCRVCKEVIKAINVKELNKHICRTL